MTEHKKQPLLLFLSVVSVNIYIYRKVTLPTFCFINSFKCGSYFIAYFYSECDRYSYDYGLVHFIMMSTEHDMGNGSKQYAWLEDDLKKVDRTKTPWVILAGHRPMYNSELDICNVDLFIPP